MTIYEPPGNTCDLRCSDCEGDAHHFAEFYVGDPESDPDHPAAAAGVPQWFGCKHCNAWSVDFDEDEGDWVLGSVEVDP
jgi:hypothetical protein